MIQRFGGALNLNVHIHALVLDGVFARDGTGALRFHAQWDLITSFYMHGWHDRSKTDVPARIYQALKPGGLL